MNIVFYEQLALVLLPIILLSLFSSSSILLDFLLIVLPVYFSILFPISPISYLFYFILFLNNIEKSIQFVSYKTKIIVKLLKQIRRLITFNKIVEMDDVKVYEQTRSFYNINPGRMTWDIIRFIIILHTTICILLFDFNFWTERFGKMDYFGVGLMDLGVGLFVFNGAVLSKKKSYRSLILMLILGFIRLLVVVLFKLDVNPKEYGIHWNFYFTLFAVGLLSNIFNSKYNFQVGLLILIFYEIICNSTLINYYSNSSLNDYILSDIRVTIFDKNKEGLFSIIPFLGVHFVLSKLGKYILNADLLIAKRNTLFLLNQLVQLYMIVSSYSDPSRRICNMNYLVYTLILLVSCMVLIYHLFDHLKVKKLFIVQTCSKNMLRIFLISNLLVLMIKLCFNISELKFYSGNLIMITYLFISVSIKY